VIVILLALIMIVGASSFVAGVAMLFQAETRRGGVVAIGATTGVGILFGLILLSLIK
jgi:hypothetical protein